MTTSWTDTRARIRSLRLIDLKGLAAATGVGEGTLVKIKYGQTANPRIDTVERLMRHFSTDAQAA